MLLEDYNFVEKELRDIFKMICCGNNNIGRSVFYGFLKVRYDQNHSFKQLQVQYLLGLNLSEKLIFCRPVETGGLAGLQTTPPQIFTKFGLLPIDNYSEKKKVAKKI